VDFGGDLAHYYRFAEIFHGKKLIQVSNKWVYEGDPILFPEIYPFEPVPADGYPNPPDSAKQVLQEFDQEFAELLADLDHAWATGDQSDLGKGIKVMRKLESLASALMQIPRTDQPGVYGPDFRLT
jgi:hypothetical protein